MSGWKRMPLQKGESSMKCEWKRLPIQTIKMAAYTIERNATTIARVEIAAHQIE